MVDVKIENSILKNENEELKNDIREIERIVMPGKIPASCEEHRNRGETENGIYKIKPTMNIEPFPVTCDFRKWFIKIFGKKQFSKKSKGSFRHYRNSSENAITVIKHDHNGKFGITATPGQSLTYFAIYTGCEYKDGRSFFVSPVQFFPKTSPTIDRHYLRPYIILVKFFKHILFCV